MRNTHLDWDGVALGISIVGLLALGLVVSVAPHHHELLVEGGVEGGAALDDLGVAQPHLLDVRVNLALGDHAGGALGLGIAHLLHPHIEDLTVGPHIRHAQLGEGAPLLGGALLLHVGLGRRRRVGSRGGVVLGVGRVVLGGRRDVGGRLGVVRRGLGRVGGLGVERGRLVLGRGVHRGGGGVRRLRVVGGGLPLVRGEVVLGLLGVGGDGDKVGDVAGVVRRGIGGGLRLGRGFALVLGVGRGVGVGGRADDPRPQEQEGGELESGIGTGRER